MPVTFDQFMNTVGSDKRWYGYVFESQSQVDTFVSHIKNSLGRVNMTDPTERKGKYHIDALLTERQHQKALQIIDNLFCKKAR